MNDTQPKPTGEWTVEHGKLHDTIIAGDERIEFPLAFWQTDKIVALHDAERERRKHEREEVQTIINALQRAKAIIYLWHGEVAWPEYQHSPEMKQINDALARVEK